MTRRTPILCRFGLHNWKPCYGVPNWINGWGRAWPLLHKTCKRCGRRVT